AHQEASGSVPTVAAVPSRTGHVAAERENAAWVTHLRLPVIQSQTNEIETRSDFVASAHFRDVRRHGVAPFVASDWGPGISVAQRRQPCPSFRHAAVSVEIDRSRATDS